MLGAAAISVRDAGVPDSIDERFTPSAATTLRHAIRDAGGNEICVLGTLDEAELVVAVRVLARGHRTAVPAILKAARPGEVVIHNHPSGVLQPSDADLGVASALGNNGVGSYIVNNDATQVYAIVEPHRPKTTIRLTADDTVNLLANGGAVATKLEGYEHRPEQMKMIEAVTRSFNQEETLTVEAGTGTGKSLAYLLPAIAWSVRNKERVIVSTHTINLQEQLIRKDLPFLTKSVGLECTTALVKGRGNYVCRRKVQQLEAQPGLLIDDDFSRETKALLAWTKTTTDGSLSDLPVRPSAEVWDQVISENDNCLRARCDFYQSCFFYESRRAAARADVIVANHHLLMADLALRSEIDSYSQNGVLPAATRVIIDEAHHLQDVATSYFGERISLATLQRTLSRLQNQRHPHKGILPALMVLLEKTDHPAAQGAARFIEARLLPRIHDIGVDAEQSFSLMLDSFEDALGREILTGSEHKLRVTPALRATALWLRVQSEAPRLSEVLAQFAAEFESVSGRLEEMTEDSANRQVLNLLTELKAMQGRLNSYALSLACFVKVDDSMCAWLEARNRARGGKMLVLNTAPIDVGPLLCKALFEPFPTVALTSATLTVNRSFEYYHSKVGLDRLKDKERIRTLHVDSPFDFADQAILAVPRDLPEPENPGYEAATHAAIRQIVLAADGGAFVLFTAYGALRRAVQVLGGEFARAGLSVLQQGETNRQLLLQRFAANRRSVLFATDSFWEGVDVRGDALRCVIITRLPFKVPTEPIEQARVEAIEKRGGMPFVEHTVPQAVIKLKQGFGRLIRSKTDWGAVVILDSRIVKKRYGQIFLSSLPPAKQLIATTEEVFASLRRFYATRRRPSDESDSSG